MKLDFFLFFLCCFCYSVFAQQDAWVYFVDKADVEAKILNPSTILSQQAINRKTAHKIPIDFRDVPVNESYIAALKSTLGITVLAKSKWMNAAHVRGETSIIAALLDLEFISTIEFADKALLNLSRPIIENDKFSLKSHLENYQYGSAQNQVEMINLDALHAENYTGEGIIIAVLDAGFPNVNTMGAFNRMRHNNRLLGGYDFVDRTSAFDLYAANSHGTKVLSAMAGYIENQYVGTSPDAFYYLFRTEDVGIENPVEESYWVEAAERADSLGVHIINSSLGYSDFDNAKYDYLPLEMDGKTTFISRGAQIASEKGILVVNSAGNSGANSWRIVTAPADAPGVMTVGAVDTNGIYASFSSRGSEYQPSQKPDVVTQGQRTAVINELDAIVLANGTSFSAPILAGAIACLWQAMPTANAEEIKDMVRRSGSKFGTPDNFLGFGIPDFQSALSQLAIPSAKIPEFKRYPNPVVNQLYINLSYDTQESLIRVYDVMGKKIIDHMYSTRNSPLDVSQLAQGVYVLSILSKNKTFNYKFIKS